MVYLYSDVLYRAGGIETYLHALAMHLKSQRIQAFVVVAELERCLLLDELVSKGLKIYRQCRIPGDRWLMRQRVMMSWLSLRLRPGDWVFCVRQPLPSLYLSLVRLVHRRRAKIAASWMLAPEFLPPPDKRVCTAVEETDAVISVSRCNRDQFSSVYGYNGLVHVVPYHNALVFSKPVPCPPGPPWKIGYIGRLERKQKNLDQLLDAFASLAGQRSDVELHLHGHGPDEVVLRQRASDAGIANRVFFHGPYDHRRDLPGIISRCQFFVYASQFEGGPCLALLELMQAGRFCVASRVGGIPDLYEGQPECGALVAPGDVSQLYHALNLALEKVALGMIDGHHIRAQYFAGFDMKAAHDAWLNALGIPAAAEEINGNSPYEAY